MKALQRKPYRQKKRGNFAIRTAMERDDPVALCWNPNNRMVLQSNEYGRVRPMPGVADVDRADETVFLGMVECPKLGGQVAEREVVQEIHDDWCRKRKLTCCLPGKPVLEIPVIQPVTMCYITDGKYGKGKKYYCFKNDSSGPVKESDSCEVCPVCKGPLRKDK